MKTARFCLSLFLSLFLTLSFASTVGQKFKSSAAPSTDKLPVTLNKSLMLQLINEVRQKGCQCADTYYYPAPPLVWNTQLEAAAYNHSIDMYKNNYFSHMAADGTKGGARIDAVGYHWKAYGENIGKGYTKEKQVVEAWLKSPEHCKNIMNKQFKELGVARVGTYWTQDFGVK